MQLFRTLDEARDAGLTGSSMCIGVFDGVHRGHQMLLRHAIDAGRRLGLPSLVLTFSDHPLRLLAPPFAPPMLSTAEEKRQLLAQQGLDACLMLDFGPDLASTSPEDFLRTIVVDICGARHLVCGEDFRFGAKGAGNVELLRRLAPELGFEVEVLGDLIDGETAVRSSRVRARLLMGDVEEAARLLGRSYTLGGEVVYGDQRGRAIGFPTANISCPPERLVPCNGVYAVRATIDGAMHGGMLNIGVRPTFGELQRAIEVHIFDFDQGIYGRTLRLDFVRRIRDERRFASADDLRRQLQADELACRRVLAESSASEEHR